MKVANSLRLAVDLARIYRRTLIVVLPLFFAAGLAEGVGIIALLPILGIVADSTAAADNTLGRWVVDIFARLGITPSLVPLLVMMVGMVLAKAGLGLLAMRQVGYATASMAADLRRHLLRSLMQARWSYFTRMPVGRLGNAMSGEVMRAAGLFNALCQILNQASQALIYGILALFISPAVTLAAVVLGCCLFAALHGLVVLVGRASAAQTVAMKKLVERLTDGLTSFKAIKAMGREDRLGPILDNLTNDINRAQRRETLSIAALHSVHEPILTVVLAIGLFFALKYLQMPFVELLFIAVLFQRTVTRIGQVQNAYQSFVRTEVSYRAVQAIIADAGEAAEGRGGTARPTLSDGIVLEEVAFAHGDQAVLEDVTFSIPAGHFVTLTGHSGSGKTTIADLVIGLYMPDRGRVTIDGVSIDEVDLNHWRNSIGYVPQEPFLLNDTILCNVTLGDPNLGAAEAQAALEAAGAWAFVEDAPGGLDYQVGERGSGLSGGQRQRIAIARALVRRPRLLILDEPTTALDPATEAEICATLRQLSGIMTVLAISHQPALVEIADDVILVKGGHAARIEPGPALGSAPTRTSVG